MTVAPRSRTTPRARARERERGYSPWPMVAIMSVVGLLYWLFAWYLEFHNVALTVPPRWASRVAQFPLLGTATPIVAQLAELFAPRVLRHLLPVVLGVMVARIATVALLQSLYELPDAETARTLRARLVRGRGDTPVRLRRRELLVDRKENPILRWGGPGPIAIDESDVVVTERFGRFHRVLGPGNHQLKRYEYVRAVLDLREQERARTGIVLTTREGIDITTDVAVRFRLSQGGEPSTPARPFPFDSAAVRRAAYAETILDDRSVQPWDALPLAYAIGQLRHNVAQLRLDQIIDPVRRAGIDPHPSLQRDMERHARIHLRDQGIELVDAQIMALRLPPDVHATFLKYWQQTQGAPPPAYSPTAEDEAAAAEAKRNRIRQAMIQSLAEGLQMSRQAATGSSRRQELIMQQMVEALADLRRQHDNSIIIPRAAWPQLGRRTGRDALPESRSGAPLLSDGEKDALPAPRSGAPLLSDGEKDALPAPRSGAPLLSDGEEDDETP